MNPIMIEGKDLLFKESYLRSLSFLCAGVAEWQTRWP